MRIPLTVVPFRLPFLRPAAFLPVLAVVVALHIGWVSETSAAKRVDVGFVGLTREDGAF